MYMTARKIPSSNRRPLRKLSICCISLQQLGPLKSVHDLELRNYISNNRGRTGLFSFKGTFENGEAVVDVTMVKKDGRVRVLGSI